MNKKITARFVLKLCAIAMITVFLYKDLAPYFEATDKLSDAMTLTKFDKGDNLLAKDLSMYETCTEIFDWKDLLKKDESDSISKIENEYRECLISALPKVQTVIGAIKFGNLVTFWIHVYSEDEELLNEAKIAFKNGVKDFNRKRPVFILMENVADAHNKSIILSAINEEMMATMIPTYEKALIDLGLRIFYSDGDAEEEEDYPPNYSI